MRFLLIILIIAFTTSASAQRVMRKGVTSNEKPVPAGLEKPDYTQKQFQGRWQEINRKDAYGKMIEFKDTLLLHFRGNKVQSKDATSMRITMDYEFEIFAPNILSIGTDEYEIRSINNDQLVLVDEHFRRVFSKKEQYYYETVGKDSIKQVEPSIPVHTNTNLIKGKWEVYRTFAKPGSVGPETILMKKLEFNSVTDSIHAKGAITFSQKGTAEYQFAEFDFSGTSIGVKLKSQHINFDVFKADERELIFGKNSELVFYARKIAD